MLGEKRKYSYRKLAIRQQAQCILYALTEPDRFEDDLHFFKDKNPITYKKLLAAKNMKDSIIETFKAEGKLYRDFTPVKKEIEKALQNIISNQLTF